MESERDGKMGGGDSESGGDLGDTLRKRVGIRVRRHRIQAELVKRSGETTGDVEGRDGRR